MLLRLQTSHTKPVEVKALISATVRSFTAPWGDREDTSFFSLPKPAPIKFAMTEKHLPFNAHQFFRVVQDVDSYPQFIFNMPSCYTDQATKVENIGESRVTGRFQAPTKIGFNAISFDYISSVSYTHPRLPVNLFPSAENDFTRKLRWHITTAADSSRIFNSFRSEWRIRPDPQSPTTASIVDYSIEMEFASALYSAVTSQFFNLLVANIDQQFSDRCQVIADQDLYTDEFLFEGQATSKETLESKNKTASAEAPAPRLDDEDESEIWQFKKARSERITKADSGNTTSDWVSQYSKEVQRLFKDIDVAKVEQLLRQNSSLEAQVKAVRDAYGQSREMEALYRRELRKLLKSALLTCSSHKSCP